MNHPLVSLRLPLSLVRRIERLATALNVPRDTLILSLLDGAVSQAEVDASAPEGGEP